MKTVNEVSKLSGISVRTLQYYDSIGLLHPHVRTEAGYRMYDWEDLQKLQQILLFRELQFPLKEIKTILESPNFDTETALQQQITLLTMEKERLESLIALAQNLKQKGDHSMDFTPFSTKKQEEYARHAKAQWSKTDAWKEYEEKSDGRSKEDNDRYGRELMAIFAEFGTRLDCDPADPAVQALVKTLQDFITDHYYTCTKQILSGLGMMYAAGDEMTENIDRAGGPGTAKLAADAIAIYCK